MLWRVGLVMKFRVMCVMGVALAAPVWAVDEDGKPTLSDEVPDNLVTPEERRFFTVELENDSLGGNSDRHYTNGVRFTYFDVLGKPPAWAEALDRALPFFTVTDKTGVFYSFGQNLYTPDDIRQVNPPAGQRPYAGFMYGSAGFTTLVDNHVDTYELTAGIVGPSALGRQTQKLVHEALNVGKPMGWKGHQLHDELALGLSYQRRYPEALSWQPRGWYLGVEPHYGFTVGNVYDYANAGFMVRFGPESARFQDTPPMVRPGISGSGFFAHPGHDFSWYLFAGVDGRAVARNIFLDGNTFRDSPHVEKRVLVADKVAGLATAWGPVRVTYSLNQRTREYRGQPKEDVFGAVSLGFRF